MVLKKKELQHFDLFWYINFGECVSMPSHATPLLLLVKGRSSMAFAGLVKQSLQLLL